MGSITECSGGVRSRRCPRSPIAGAPPCPARVSPGPPSSSPGRPAFWRPYPPSSTTYAGSTGPSALGAVWMLVLITLNGASILAGLAVLSVASRHTRRAYVTALVALAGFGLMAQPALFTVPLLSGLIPVVPALSGLVPTRWVTEPARPAPPPPMREFVPMRLVPLPAGWWERRPADAPVRREDPPPYTTIAVESIDLADGVPCAPPSPLGEFRASKKARSSDLALHRSGWRDLNPRPPRPERGTLPSCATSRCCPQHRFHAAGQ